MAYSQKDRPMRITTALGETELLLYGFTGNEAISAPFEYRVTMLSEETSINLKSLLRTPATIALRLADDSYRYINGIFSFLRQAELGGDKLVTYEATIVPKVWLLNLYSNCRIFQKKTVPQIVEQVLKDRGITDLKLQLTGTYPQRDYCVQYRETDFNFISRLLEQEGISYFFEHAEKKHTIVFVDKSTAFKPCPNQAKARYSLGQTGWADEDGVASMDRLEQVYTGKISLTDYNFETPSASLLATLGNQEEGYDYPGKYADRSGGDRYARIRLEEEEVKNLTMLGTGRCRAFQSGYRFTLQNHYRDDNNVDYTLVSIRHEAKDSSYRADGRQAEPFSYKNSFEAVPNSIPYRPPARARKPVVQGSQTALVTGRSGEEIYVDKYGRVKVQFYWDREGTKNENSSCWVRVSQVWAGKNWGWMTIPRIGQEVIVDFLEGDPDRPIITGRVYNSDQMPPYALPANQTQSGIKSRSSKGGGTANYNEIRLEDIKGSEMITIQAEKDMETTVEHDHALTVQNNRTITVDGTHTETIKKDTAITITEGNEDLAIKMGNRTTTLNQGNMSTSLKMGNKSTKMDLGKGTTEAMQSIELIVGQSSVKLDQTGVTIKGMMIKIEGMVQIEAKAPITQVKGDGMLILKGGLTLIN